MTGNNTLLAPLRKELNGIFVSVGSDEKGGKDRMPSLRRWEKPGFLFSTNACEDEARLLVLISCLTEKHWTWEKKNGLLLLDKAIPVPKTDLSNFQPRDGYTEVQSCISLLMRRECAGKTDMETVRQLAKAEEKGSRHLEIYCRRLHSTLAVMLREKKEMPGELVYYLAAVLNEASEVKT